jgi:predicted acylesterase/phospholipase RssA
MFTRLSRFSGLYGRAENAGYEFENLAGTSAGVTVASLLAVVYKSEDIKRKLERLNYTDFKDEELLDKQVGNEYNYF